MIQNEPLPLWALSIGVVIPFVAILAVCICGCKKSVPKNELQGLAGMVKITNPEETLNHNHAQHENRSVSIPNNEVASVEIADGNRRSSATVNRSLPAIPSDSERLRSTGNTIWENELNGDTSSELYATVGDSKQVSQPCDGVSQGNRTPKSVKTLELQLAEGKDNEHGALTKTEEFNHYARLKAEHPYDKLKKSEHPYAQLRSSVDNHDNEKPGPSHVNMRNGEEVDVSLHSSNSEVPTNKNPIPPPRTRKSASHNSIVTSDNVSSDTLVDIPAATAIAGRISANQELPYMTPPIPATNFSGDSQDSKGYTSISVREPLANIKAQVKGNNQRNQTVEMVDSHYATVSDDSDEMYAAIEEPGQLYTSGSETYAQIQPSIPEPVLSVEPVLSNESASYPPQPPSVDSLKHVAQAHSRQASSSSATSSVANLGSPKPEKRQANSPLPPPPPSGSPEIHSADKRNLLSADSMNLEEMYAKVMKKKRTAENEATDINSRGETLSNASRITAETSQNHLSVSRECLRTLQEPDRTSICSTEIMEDSSILLSSCDTQSQLKVAPHSPVDKIYDITETSMTAKGKYVDPGYEIVESHDTFSSVNEAGSKQSDFSEDMCNSTINTSNFCNNNSTYNSRANDNNNNNSNNENRTESDCYPRYESVNPVGGCSDDCREFTIFGDDIGEPNYESMPSEETEHSYAGVHGASGGSEVDPNYEMVENEDPNYESVNYFEANNDPPYERLQNDVRDSDADMIPGYEQVRHHSNIPKPENQTVHSTGNMQTEGSSEPGYEEVGRKKADSQSDVWRRDRPVSGDVPSVSSIHPPPLESAKLGDGEIYMNISDEKKLYP